MIIFGGITVLNYTADVQMYDLVNNTWLSPGTSAPSQRWAMTVQEYNGIMFVLSGGNYI